MEFKPEDFKNLKYPCYEVPHTKNLLEVFPELSRYPEFLINEHMLDTNRVIRHIIYLYDKQSPLVSEKNLNKRKMIAARLAGFELVNKKYPEDVEQMITGRNVYVNRMICAYVRNQRDVQYALLMTGLSQFYDNLSQLSKPSDASIEMDDLNKKSTLFNHTSKMIAMLEESATEVFNGDTHLMYEIDEIEQEEQGKIQSYPEWVSAQRESGALQKDFDKMKKQNVV